MPGLNVSNVRHLLNLAGNPWSARESRITALDDDARRSLLGVLVDRRQLAELARKPRFATAIAGLPVAMDWRNVGGRNHISPVKDQKHCGACVSFCVCAAVESVVSIATGQITDLSEADLHFCSSHGAGCGGWWPSDAIDQATARGIPVDELFPYDSAFDGAGTPGCRIDPHREARLYRPSGQSVLMTTAERKQWLSSRGPVCAAFHVYDDFFLAGTGIYRHLTGNHAGYHCVEVVGYSDTDRCWIAKNSWGPDWGDSGFFRIGYGECGIDDTSTDRDPDGSLNQFPMYGIEGVQIPGGWRGFELAPQGSAALNGGLAAVTRIPGSMETWWIGENGSVQAAFWYDGGQWQRYELAPAGSASPEGAIAAVSRIPGSMETWWIGANGSVQAAFWYEGGQWTRYELAPAGSASPAGGIAVVSRIPGSMELWWTGANGSVQGAFWYEGGQWTRYELAPGGSAAADGAITVVSRIPGSMELWWVTGNGSVQAAFWYEGGQWTRYELAPAGSASPQGGIAAVSRIPGSMELWWTGANASVQAAFWYEGGQWTRYELAPAGHASVNGGIAAVSRIPNSLELWWIGGDGSVQDAFWYEGNAWQRFALAPAGSASASGRIASVSRIPDSMELWWTGSNGSIGDSFWYP
ncbi:C1 family peptidase [Pseudoduganella dura]|nr:C1 family peptidase [Pseudoduganella dura]